MGRAYTAQRYDLRRQAQVVAQRLSIGSSVLEVAPGPRFFAVELAKLRDFKIIGLDISRTFVEIAEENRDPSPSRATGPDQIQLRDSAIGLC
jgi:ubiquinone/menaquinone biosynthesis C-methylase UbiE